MRAWRRPARAGLLQQAARSHNEGVAVRLRRRRTATGHRQGLYPKRQSSNRLAFFFGAQRVRNRSGQGLYKANAHPSRGGRFALCTSGPCNRCVCAAGATRRPIRVTNSASLNHRRPRRLWSAPYGGAYDGVIRSGPVFRVLAGWDSQGWRQIRADSQLCVKGGPGVGR